MLLAENPNGLLVFRDELVGLWRTLDKAGYENARSFYLEAWDGLGIYIYDRVGRGHLFIPSTTLSLFGGLTPGNLGSYLQAAEDGGTGDDGFVQRHQLGVWPDLPPGWTCVDRAPDAAARQQAYDLFATLAVLDPELLKADIEGDAFDDQAKIPYLRFTEAARKKFVVWRTKLEAQVRGMEDNPAFAAHLGKYRSLIPSIALLCHLGSGGSGKVTEAALDMALLWDTYLRSHARRIYGSRRGDDQRYILERMALDRLLEIPEGERTERNLFTYARRWRGIEEVTDLTEVLERLQKRGWVRVHEPEPTGKAGRPPSPRIELSPRACARESTHA